MQADRAAQEIKFALSDARALCEKLGFLGGRGSWQRQAAGVLIRCPAHEDRSPSCSVQRRDGVILWRCHACGATGDALSLVARSHGLTLRGDDFRQVLILAAELAGLHGLVVELETGHAPTERRPPVPRPEPEPERDYPPAAEVAALWASTTELDADAMAWAEARGLDGEMLGARYDGGFALARSLPADGELPRWAAYGGASWRESGHRVVVPVYDYAGNMRSVRACRIVDGDGPKRLPPAGHRASGLVTACEFGLAMLRGTFEPERVLVLEGEPDFLAAATKRVPRPYARIGIMSGSWTAQIAARIPRAATVTVYTHADDAGEKYAAAIVASLPHHEVRRWSPKEAA